MLKPFRTPRVRSDRHLAAIRSMPCLICGKHSPSEPAHIRLSRAEYKIEQAGMGAKPHDFLTVPLCAEHHRNGNDAEHMIGTKAFWRQHGIDPIPIALKLNELSPDQIRMKAYLVAVRLFAPA